MRIFRYALLCALFFAFGLLYSTQLPRLKQWTLDQIEAISLQKADLRVKVQDLRINLFPLSVKLFKIELHPRGEMAAKIAPSTVDEIYLSLQIPPLLVGKILVDEIRIAHPIATLILKQDKSDATNVHPSFPWDRFIKLPFKKLSVTGVDANLRFDGPGVLAKTKGMDILLEKTDRAALLELNAPELWLKRRDIQSSLIQTSLKTRIVTQRDAIQLAYFKFVHNNDFAIATGLAKGSVPNLALQSVNGRALTEGNLTELGRLAGDLFPNVKLPALQGQARLQLDVTQTPNASLRLLGNLNLDHFKIDQFHIGLVKGEVLFRENQISSPKIMIANPAGEAIVENFNLDLNGEKRIAGRLVPNELEIKRLLIELGVGDTPLHVPVTGRLPCEGTLTPLVLNCSGDISVHDMRVHSEPENKTIIAANVLRAIGSFNLNGERIEIPAADIYVGESHGTANGRVGFKDGFHFNYQTDQLDFKDIKSLSDLKFEGTIALKGFTEGDGHFAVMDAHVTGHDFWFEDYGIGKIDADLRYESGNLILKNIEGAFGISDYRGQVKVRLVKPTGIEGRAESDKFNIRDLTQMMSRKAAMPFTAEGPGQFNLDVNGPLEFTKLTYKIKTNIFSGVIAQESFKDLHFDIHADQGVVKTDRVSLRKGDALIEARGEGFPDGNIKVNLKGRGIRLEDFETPKLMGTTLSGLVSIDMTLGDYVLRPTTDLRVALSETMVNGENLQESRFGLIFTPDELRGQGQFFNQVTSQFIFPVTDKGRFELKLSAKDYDFSPLFTLIGGNNARKDYETRLTADIELYSPHGGFWNSVGQARIPNIFVRHGNAQMRNPTPWTFDFNEGLVKANGVSLSGDNTQLSFKGARQQSGSLNFNVNGRINLNLLTFLTPFFHDMRGDLSISTQIAGTLDQMELLGSAFIDQGYIKLQEFPHPLEDLKADVLFSQTRALVNRFRARFAGGNLTATGTVGFKALKQVPVDLTAEVERVTMNVPEGLVTKGSGKLTVTGDWFPYLLKGNYDVTSGLYSKNFGVDTGSDLSIKRSRYLPNVILAKEFEPVELNLMANLPQNVYIKNNMMDSEVRGTMQIKGTPHHPALLGEISAVPGGKISFHETPFSVVNASAKFNSPNEINPALFAQAGTRVKEHDINLLVQGSLANLKLELTSQPPMPEQSIISLLALGISDETIGQQNLRQQNLGQQNDEQLKNSSYQIGSVILSDNPIQKQIKKTLGLDFRFTPRVDETKNTVQPSVVAEKEWTPRIKTSASRTIGEQTTQDVKVEYKLNRNFSVLGTYEARDAGTTSTTTTVNTSSTNGGVATDILGVDLQFQVDFK